MFVPTVCPVSKTRSRDTCPSLSIHVEGDVCSNCLSSFEDSVQGYLSPGSVTGWDLWELWDTLGYLSPGNVTGWEFWEGLAAPRSTSTSTVIRIGWWDRGSISCLLFCSTQ